MTVTAPSELEYVDNSDAYKNFINSVDSEVTKSNVYHELRHGNNGKGWTIMEVIRDGLNKNTRYKVKGVR